MRALFHASSFAARLVLVVAAVAATGSVRADPARPAASAAPASSVASPVAPPAVPADRQASALRACSQRADLLFVRKCVQSCMIDSKTKTRVMKESFDREACQQRCGHQPEIPSFVDSCMKRAGLASPAPAAAAARGAPVAAR